MSWFTQNEKSVHIPKIPHHIQCWRENFFEKRKHRVATHTRAIKKSTLVRSKPLSLGNISAKVKGKPGIYHQAYIIGTIPITRERISERYRDIFFCSISIWIHNNQKNIFSNRNSLKKHFRILRILSYVKKSWQKTGAQYYVLTSDFLWNYPYQHLVLAHTHNPLGCVFILSSLFTHEYTTSSTSKSSHNTVFTFFPFIWTYTSIERECTDDDDTSLCWNSS